MMIQNYRSTIVMILMCLFLVSCQVFWEETASHTNIPSDSDYTAPCWTDIRPTISNRADVEQILNKLNIEYEITMTITEGDTYRWITENPILTDGLDISDVNVSVSFDESDVVWQIAFVPTNICSEYIVDWFGVPPVVLRYENGKHINLVYPDQGLIFLINLYNSKNISTVFIRTPTSAGYWVDQFSEAERSSWDEVKSILAQNCPQNTESTSPFSCP